MKTYCQGCGQETKKYEINCLNCGARMSVPNIPAYTGLSVLSLFIFLPTGLIALINSLQINGKVMEGNFEEAVKYSKRARLWIIISLAFLMIYILFNLIAYFNKTNVDSKINNVEKNTQKVIPSVTSSGIDKCKNICQPAESAACKSVYNDCVNRNK